MLLKWEISHMTLKHSKYVLSLIDGEIIWVVVWSFSKKTGGLGTGFFRFCSCGAGGGGLGREGAILSLGFCTE